ncbi:O-acetylhomoserine aminocarboxypropyltransferase/cysteine synthase family protein [Compostimonas suwonensis]|uniref:homocysteine desulfhydrase n=1 Tax=Compostimonas suwonensis TaxID=1048394 RepID=A0A2M9BWI5_9MICO|nr:aminotransferase class I/II-fold pyridoxal phosphate-dependent enzyme [Compostimonas suwonensis]PJJ62323.1 O-acetylhomoserine (thiol)-lyase [Compostimonas suwonensis]
MTSKPTPVHDFETRQIHAGAIVDSQVGARIGPVYQTAGYLFSSFDDAEARFAGTTAANVYSRSDNPTNAAAARRLADLEGGVAGVLVGSGQAAIAATLFALASQGDHILATANLYEGTRQMFQGSLARQGLVVEYVPESASDEEWASKVTERTRAIYTETIPNPKNTVVDLERLAGVAHRAGVPLVVDSTVATPYLCRPLEWGADIVIHSTSKWLAGHGSVIGGAVIDGGRFDWAANAERFPQLTESPRPGVGSFVERFGASAFSVYLRSVIVLEYGPTVPPTSTFLLLHGVETLSVRMDRHVANAQVVAEWLDAHPAVAGVDYPGLPSNPYHERAKKYLPKGAGSIVSFDLAGGRPAARRFIDALSLISNMTHIGDVRTLALHTGSTIHGRLTEEERLDAGITPGLIRLSIGLESARDIIGDLEQALQRATEE